MTTVPVIIRNQRPKKWPAIALRVCLMGSLACCAMTLIFQMAGVPGVLTLLMTIPMLGGFAGAFCIAVYSLIVRPVDKLALGDNLEIWPSKKRFTIGDIEGVEFVSRPEEDFGELDTVADSQAVQIIARGRHFVYRLRLVLNKMDTARLREWMHEKGMQAFGTDGGRGD